MARGNVVQYVWASWEATAHVGGIRVYLHMQAASESISTCRRHQRQPPHAGGIRGNPHMQAASDAIPTSAAGSSLSSPCVTLLFLILPPGYGPGSSGKLALNLHCSGLQCVRAPIDSTVAVLIFPLGRLVSLSISLYARYASRSVIPASSLVLGVSCPVVKVAV